MNKQSILIGYTKPEPSHTDSSNVTKIALDLKRANRHGLIAGATGTGKTVTLQALAESFLVVVCLYFLSMLKAMFLVLVRRENLTQK